MYGSIVWLASADVIKNALIWHGGLRNRLENSLTNKKNPKIKPTKPKLKKTLEQGPIAILLLLK